MGALFLSLMACAVATGVAGLLLKVFDLSNVVILFLFTVVLVSFRWGKAAGGMAAMVGVVCFDFFFVPPVFSFHLSDTQYLFTLALMLIVALMIGQLAARLRVEAASAREGERRATALAHVAHALSAATSVQQVENICLDAVVPLFSARGALMLANAEGHMTSQYAFFDEGVARWACQRGQATEMATHTSTHATTLYVPLSITSTTYGVLAFEASSRAWLADPEERRFLEACCVQLAQALDRIRCADLARETQIRMEGEQLRHALLAAVSHDLKTPLTAIRGLAETLEMEATQSHDGCGGMARSIHRQADALHRLVTNLLDLARMQAHGVHLDLDWHDIGEVVGSALAAMSSTLGERRVHAELAGAPLVRIDAVLFERVLVNLFDNAAKYTPATSSIWIRARVCSGALQLDVEDDGPGLPKGVEPKALLEPFTRGVRESATAGVGLGLALCRCILEAHGGSIEAGARLPRGACFRINLPIGPLPDIEQEPFA